MLLQIILYYSEQYYVIPDNIVEYSQHTSIQSSGSSIDPRTRLVTQCSTGVASTEESKILQAVCNHTCDIKYNCRARDVLLK